MQNYIQKCDRGQGTVKIHINKLTSVITYIKSSHFDSFIKDNIACHFRGTKNLKSVVVIHNR